MIHHRSPTFLRQRATHPLPWTRSRAACRKTAINGILKGKAVPLQAWTGPEGSRRLRLPDFKAIGTLMW